MEDIYLIVGLGNPGGQYAQTRHNVGFMAVERLGQRLRGSWASEDRFKARLSRVEFRDRKVLLCEPQTYMNSSGTAVRAVAAYYKIPAQRILVSVDDADLQFGAVRLRGDGSSGGHHGLESIEQHLGTRVYARQRIGIGRQVAGVRDIAGYVLGRFGPDENPLLEMVLARVADQMECWLVAGLEKAMNQFNGVIKPPMAKES